MFIMCINMIHVYSSVYDHDKAIDPERPWTLCKFSYKSTFDMLCNDEQGCISHMVKNTYISCVKNQNPNLNPLLITEIMDMYSRNDLKQLISYMVNVLECIDMILSNNAIVNIETVSPHNQQWTSPVMLALNKLLSMNESCKAYFWKYKLFIETLCRHDKPIATINIVLCEKMLITSCYNNEMLRKNDIRLMNEMYDVACCYCERSVHEHDVKNGIWYIFVLSKNIFKNMVFELFLAKRCKMLLSHNVVKIISFRSFSWIFSIHKLSCVWCKKVVYLTTWNDLNRSFSRADVPIYQPIRAQLKGQRSYQSGNKQFSTMITFSSNFPHKNGFFTKNIHRIISNLCKIISEHRGDHTVSTRKQMVCIILHKLPSKKHHDHAQ